MMRFSTLKAYIELWLNDPANQYDTKRVLVCSGPDDPPNYPNRFVCLTAIPGVGPQVDGLAEGVAWQLRVAGDQRSYSDSEALAFGLDKYLLSPAPMDFAGERVINIARIGSAPVPLLMDQSNRTQFVCNYSMITKSLIAQ